MKKTLYTLLFSVLFILHASAQTPLTSAVNISVKTIKGDVIELFPLLDQGKIVVIDLCAAESQSVWALA